MQLQYVLCIKTHCTLFETIHGTNNNLFEIPNNHRSLISVYDRGLS